MKGLLIKDICLLKTQANFFAIVCVIGLIMTFTDVGPQFVVSYVTIIFSMFTLSTISYDEYDNGAAFLFTLPISRKGYVTEKYVFGLLICITTWSLSTILAAICTFIKTPQTDMMQWLLSVTVYLALVFVFLSLTLPVQLKFGAEKSRIALFGVVGIMFILGFGVIKLLEFLGYPPQEILDNLSTMGLASFVGIAVAAGAVIFILSYTISVKIMEKKQY